MKKGIACMCSYNGHTIGNNGNVTLKLKCRYSEMTNYIQIIQMLNNDVSIAVKQVQEKQFPLGTFRVKEIKVDHDGEGMITVNSMSDFVEMDNLNKLIVAQKGEEAKVSFTADIELEDDEDDDEGWD